MLVYTTVFSIGLYFVIVIGVWKSCAYVIDAMPLLKLSTTLDGW